MTKKRSEYLEYAEHAAKLERAGDFKGAAFAWQVASSYALNPENRHWAESRSQRCDIRIGCYREVAA